MGVSLPVDALLSIWADDNELWSGEVTDNETIYINKPNVFGGISSQGGVQGYVDVQFGGSAQVKNVYLASKVATLTSSYRGLFTLMLKQVYLGTSPNLKVWELICRRTQKQVDGVTPIWYQAKADINGDMNPVHILYEIITSPIFGLGIPSELLDTDSFEDAADQLYTEEFGLSLTLDHQSDAATIIKDVCAIINGFLNKDFATGKLGLKLVRDDYVAETVPAIDEAVIIDLATFTRGTLINRVNQISVNYTHPDTFETATFTIQDTASFAAQGVLVAESYSYMAIRSHTLANQVATRELRLAATDPFTIKFTGNATLRQYTRGDVLKVSWAALGISSAIVRIIEIDYGTFTDQKVTITAVEDFFSIGDTVFSDIPSSAWVSPLQDPIDATYVLVLEAPYWYIAKDILGESIAAEQTVATGLSFVAAVRPSDSSKEAAVLLSVEGGTYLNVLSTLKFCPSATIVSGLAATAADAVVSLANMVDINEVQPEALCLLGDEWLYITEVDLANSTVTVVRGMIDTIPVAHSAGDRIYFVGDGSAIVGDELASGTSYNVKILSSTSKGMLDIDDATAHAGTMAGRAIRPYPAGKFARSGYTFTWAHRNRTLQVGVVVRQTDASLTPETGTTYTLARKSGATVLHTITGITDDTWLDIYYQVAVTGADVTSMNGTYSYNAMLNSKPQFDNGTDHIWWSGSAWYMTHLADVENTSPAEGYTCATLLGTWTPIGTAGGTVVSAESLPADFSAELTTVRDGHSSWQTPTI